MSTEEAPLLAKHKGVREALESYVRNPTTALEPIDTPVWWLVSQTLFEVANSPNTKIRSSLARATRAQKIIADRLVGTRRPGSHPAVAKDTKVAFIDLTQGMIEEAPHE